MRHHQVRLVLDVLMLLWLLAMLATIAYYLFVEPMEF